MGNRNLTYKWWKDKMANKIVIEKGILDWENPIRGIYGIFIREKEDVYCAYVGRQTIYIIDSFHLVVRIEVIWLKLKVAIVRMKKLNKH